MSAETILHHAAALFALPIDAITGDGRSRQAVAARQAVAYALRRDDWTMVAIGAALGRDHTTICYAVRAAERRAVASPAYALDLCELIGGAR